ncbi:tRNA methyltransferase 1 [Dinochytrium kinnereticum]|nr:tRNA methyltransferase 1 [Dinochytrium kinnereticum]
MATLAGSQAEACWAKYGTMPIANASFCHEMSLRILLHTIQSTAAKYKRSIVPLLSCSIDFYVRVFVEVKISASMSKHAASLSSLVYSCVGCKSFSTQTMGGYQEKEGGNRKFKYPILNTSNVCSFCEQKLHVGGPIYSGPIHNTEFVNKLVARVKASEGDFGTKKRMVGMLTVISEELPDKLLYFSLPALCNVLHCNIPSFKMFCSAILNAGFRVSLSHCLTNSIKTDAPTTLIWDILRAWVATTPVSEKVRNEPSPSRSILMQTSTHTVDFTIHPEVEAYSKKERLVRYQENPHKNWGPKARASAKNGGREKDGKKDSNDGKKKEVEEEEEEEEVQSKKRPRST